MHFVKYLSRMYMEGTIWYNDFSELTPIHCPRDMVTLSAAFEKNYAGLRELWVKEGNKSHQSDR